MPGIEQSPISGITPICAIQGDYFKSDYVEQVVRTQGIVTADLDITSQKGFFIQKESCDGDPATSDGIFIDLQSKQDLVAAGDEVEVLGVVKENYGNTEIDVITGTVTVLASGLPLPAATNLHPPSDNKTSRWYYESLEGMTVVLDDARVVGPTDSSNITWVVRSDLGIGRVYQDDAAGTGEVVCVGNGGLFKVEQATVGERLLALSGVLDYDFGKYCLQLTAPPSPVPSAKNHNANQPRQELSQNAITLATFNLHDLFDTVNDPATDDRVLRFPEYVRRSQKIALAIHEVLGEPDLLAIQEVENAAVIEDLLTLGVIQADYRVLLVEGPDLRGQDVALLYHSERVEMIESRVHQGCTKLVDGLGVDGNQDVYNPQNAITCDTDGDGIADGNRLFSRPPLQVRVKVYSQGDRNNQTASEWVELTLLIDHFKSKYEDSSVTPYTQPRRIEEAQFIASLVQQLRKAEPNGFLFVLGDLNDYPNSPPLAVLKAAGLQDLTQLIPHDERFTYNYQGVSQVLDYVMYYPAVGLAPIAVQAFHVNADYPYKLQSQPQIYYRSSDHDPLLVTLFPMPFRVNLPLGAK